MEKREIITQIGKIDKIRSQRNEISEHNCESIAEMVVQTR